jgi:Domain of unknown function (DUF4157)
VGTSREFELLRTAAPRAPMTRRRSPNGEHAFSALLRCYGNRYIARALADDVTFAPTGVQEGIERARGGGYPLDAGLREQLQPHFSQDLEIVRLHTDPRADVLSRAVGARAFTVGSDIFFRGGEYAPGTTEGRTLLGHELTHVDQQDGASIGGRLEIGPPDGELEREAQSAVGDLVRREQETTVFRKPEPREDERAGPEEPAGA